MGHKIENIRAQLGHIRGTAGAQLGHKVTWGTVEAKAVEAQLGHNIRTNKRKSSLGTVGAQLRHSWGRVKVKAIVKVRN